MSLVDKTKSPRARKGARPAIGNERFLEADAHRDAFNFGGRLRQFRRDRGWSLERAAEAVGVPASTLSRIENRKMSPTLELIQKIVRAMGLHPYDVLGRGNVEESIGKMSVTRKGEEDFTELPNIFYAPLHPGLDKPFGIRPILVTLFARTVEEYGGLTAHSGEEFLFVLSGEVELHLEGKDPVRLDVGDSILFDSHIPHAYVAAGGVQAKLIIVATTVDAPFSDVTGTIAG